MNVFPYLPYPSNSANSGKHQLQEFSLKVREDILTNSYLQNELKVTEKNPLVFHQHVSCGYVSYTYINGTYTK